MIDYEKITDDWNMLHNLIQEKAIRIAEFRGYEIDDNTYMKSYILCDNEEILIQMRGIMEHEDLEDEYTFFMYIPQSYINDDDYFEKEKIKLKEEEDSKNV